MHVDPERFRPQVANWFSNNPEYADIATDDFGDPRWFNELIISVYPCPPSEKVNGIIRQIALEIVNDRQTTSLLGRLDSIPRLPARHNHACPKCGCKNVRSQEAHSDTGMDEMEGTCEGCGFNDELGAFRSPKFESKLGSKLAMLEAVENPEFAADDLDSQLQDVHVDEMTGDGKVILRFKSKPLQPADRTKITKDAWFTVGDFTKDFPGEFEKITAAVQDAFNRATPVRVSSQTEIGQRETLADFKGAYANFGGAALAGDDLDEGPATGQLRVHVFVEVLVPLEEVGEVPEPVGAEIPGEFS